MISLEILADLVMVVHAAFSLFVMLGLVFILTGMILGWSWINNTRFRVLHLAATSIVINTCVDEYPLPVQRGRRSIARTNNRFLRFWP